jgi:Fic family protein
MTLLKSCTPIRLPPKLDWRRLSPPLGHAREELARFDETLRLIPLPVLEILKWEDSIETIRSQNIQTHLLEVLQFALLKEAEEKRAAMLQKILDAKEGLDFALQWSLKKPLSTSFLCKLHARVKRDAPNPEEIGHLRKRQNWIGAEACPIEEAYFFPPKAHLVPKYLKEWASYQKMSQEPLVQLALLFAQLLIIHPFMDGNGRVARDYIPCFLYKKKLISKPFLFLSSYFQDHLLQYVQKLYDISESGDWESWILYFLKGITVRSQRMSAQAKRLYELYLEVGRVDPFRHPVCLRKKKNLTEKSKGFFVFESLFDAIR